MKRDTIDSFFAHRIKVSAPHSPYPKLPRRSLGVHHLANQQQYYEESNKKKLKTDFFQPFKR